METKMQPNEMNAALDSLESKATDPSLFVATNGLRLRLRRVPQMAILTAARRLTAPKVPVQMDEDKQRPMENPMDPGYQIALRNYNFDIGILATNIYFILGSEVEALPEDLLPVESPMWSDRLLAADPEADIPPDGTRRYLKWLQYYALSDADQVELLQRLVKWSGGTLEQDVQNVQRSFRPDEARDTVGRVLASVESELGTGNGEEVRNGTGPGSEGSSPVQPLQLVSMDSPPAL